MNAIFVKKGTCILAVLVSIMLVSAISYAAGQFSDNYTIESDVISAGGGESSSIPSGGNYTAEHTTGQPVVGYSESTGYKNYAGFWHTVPPVVAAGDTDGDGILDDGDGNGTPGDNPCTGGNTSNCDDNCVLTANPTQADVDGDLVGDDCDNCTVVANTDQIDTNSGQDDNDALAGDQHYGNACDPDFDNNGSVSLGDFNVWRANYRQFVPPASPDLDLDNNGNVGLGDFNIWRQYYRSAPGPGIGG